nr:GNAT family protein [Aliikangiella sp. G2MR2-5]
MRAMTPEDADSVFEYRNQPDVKLFQGWTPENAKEVADYANEMAGREVAAPGHWFQVILESKPEGEQKGKVIGDMAFCIEPEMKKQAELGIALDSRQQGKGFALEATKALVSYLFETFELHRIHVSIDPENGPSRKLCHRIGFREEAHLKQAVFFKGEWVDDIIMAMLHSEWQALTK